MAEIRQRCSVRVQRHAATIPGGSCYRADAIRRVKAMRKTILVLASAATLAAAALAAPAPAEARDGGAVAAGVLGGLAAGAIIGGAAASAPPPAYYAPGPGYVSGPPCYWHRERFWDGYGWRIRRVRMCE